MKKLLILFLLIAPFAFGADCAGSGSVISITGACTTTQNQQTIKADANGGGFTVTLLSCSASRTNLTQFFQKVDSSANTVVIDGNGAQTVNGAANFTLTASRNSLRVRCDGAGDWLVEFGGYSSISGSVGTTNLADDSITEPKLKAVNSPTDEYCLTYESTVGDFEWQTCGGGLVIASTTITGGSGTTNVLVDNGGTLAESDITTYESALEGVIDLQDLQGAVVDSQVPDTITINGTNTVFPSSLSSTAMADDKVWVGDSSSAVTPRAVPDCDNATSSKLLYDTATNTWSCGTDQSSLSGDSMPDFVTNKRWGVCSWATLSDTAPSCWGAIGGTPMTNYTTGATINQLRNLNRMIGLKYTTGGTSGNMTGNATAANWTVFSSNAGLTYADPVSITKIATDSTITSERFWVGLCQNAAGIDYTQYSTSATTTSANHSFVMIGYDTGGAANTANFQCCSADGSAGANSMACTDTGVAVVASTLYTLKVDCTNGETTGCNCVINGTSTNITPKITSANLSMGTCFHVRTLTGSARSLVWYKTEGISN